MKKIIKISLALLFGLSLSSCDLISPYIPFVPTSEDDNNSTNKNQKQDTSVVNDIDVHYYSEESVELAKTGKLGDIYYTCAADVVDAVADSVVEIVTETITTSYWYGKQISQGAGSGVIINEDGYIVTNNHVIEDADTISVLLRDSSNYVAELIATDAEADIAIIKINPTVELTYAVVGNSDSLRVGDDILAIGNPLGSLGGSVTKGIISGKDREVSSEDGYTMTLLQVDCAINPGNSGGALFDMNGYLVGVVNSKYTETSSGVAVDGIGFAIPSKIAFQVFEELAAYGYVKGRPTLNISIVYGTLKYGNRQSITGVFVASSNNDLFQANDKIVSIDGVSVSDEESCIAIIRSHSVGDSVSVVIIRNQQEMTITATLEEQVPSLEAN